LAAVHGFDEAERLAALRALEILDSAPEPAFDALVRAASLVCGAPIALISLIDADRQWFKANLGLPGVTETPRDLAFCAHAILGDDILEVADAAVDPRFADNPLVTGNPDIRFYAGAPLRLKDGSTVGTLCVIDRRARRLDDTQREILSSLALTASAMLEDRKTQSTVQKLLLDIETNRDARIQVEQILTQERQHQANILAATGVGTWEWHVPTGAMRFSDRWAAILGYTASELADVTVDFVRNALHPQDAVRRKAEIEAHFGGMSEYYESEVRLRHRAGHYVWVQSRGVMASRTAAGDPAWVSGTWQDISARKQQEAALRASEEFLEQTGRLAQVGGWALDIATGKLTWTAETYRIYGLPADTRPDVDAAIDFYAPEARPVIRSAVETAMVDGTGWDLELPFIRADGHRIWVRALGSVTFDEGKPVRLSGAFQDITRRVEERLALQAANERLALATDGGGVGIWDWDLITDRKVWSPQMHRLYGLACREGVMPHDVWQALIHPDDRERLVEAVQAALVGTRPYEVEFRAVLDDGTVRYLRGAGRVTRDAAGRAVRMIGVSWDITEQRRLAARLADQHEMLRVTLRSIGDGVITTDAAGMVTWLNPVAERLTGWTAEEAAGLPLAEVFNILNEDTREPVASPVDVCLAEGRVVGLANHTLLLSREGGEYGIEDSAAPIRSEQGEVLGVVLVFHDVSEQRRLSGEMSYRASHDSLTGLVNRSEFETRLRWLLHMAHADQSENALLYIDLDEFKIINDTCGHAAGDQVLRQVARLLAEVVRASDTLARLGGDEFAIILDHCSAKQAFLLAQRICDRMESFRFTHEERRFRIGASIGLVPVDERWTTTEAIMQAADSSCYAAKEAGRNRVHCWFDSDRSMHARRGEMQWTERLEQALEENRFVLFAQRIQPLDHRHDGIHAEVLLRLMEKDGSLVAPGAFLPAAERYHLAPRIDRWVLQRALTWMQGLPAPLPGVVDTICVNLSGQSVGDRAFHNWAIELLTEAGARTRARLCLEITETAAITNLADAASFVGKVRALGVRVALDDFGSGAASFGYLKNLAVDFLKIDGQFIRDLINDRLDEAAVRCFADVARVAGLRTVAECVDDPDVLQQLRSMGVNFAQGYLIHRPAPIDELVPA
jgi:diguanylate cyclase (GGDEF)-like protein/PAS domain S-box-containing protein